MTVGERIALRRKALGLTQSELASLMGYKSKAAISKIETGVNDIAQSTIVKFAEVLDTSVAFLMGWDSAEKERPNRGNFDIQYFAEDPLPQVTMIGRAMEKSSPEKREQMLQLLRIAFPEEFEE